jgi:hypothetical protein
MKSIDADYYNRYEIMKAAEEAGVDQDDPNWKCLTDRQKWAVIAEFNGQNFFKKINLDYSMKTQEEIVLKVLKG